MTFLQPMDTPPKNWLELRDLLMQRLQPKDLTAAYKAQFRARGGHHSEDIHPYVEALQKLTKIAWPCWIQWPARKW